MPGQLSFWIPPSGRLGSLPGTKTMRSSPVRPPATVSTTRAPTAWERPAPPSSVSSFLPGTLTSPSRWATSHPSHLSSIISADINNILPYQKGGKAFRNKTLRFKSAILFVEYYCSIKSHKFLIYSLQKVMSSANCAFLIE